MAKLKKEVNQMDRHSIEALVSIIINSAIGGNKDSFERALTALRGKPSEEKIYGLCSITMHLRVGEVDEYFTKRIEEATPTKISQPA